MGFIAVNTTDRPIHRDVIADALWPDQDPENARGRLRTALWRLHKKIGDKAFQAIGQDNATIWLKADGISLPHRDFERTVRDISAIPLEEMTDDDFRTLDQALELYSAPLMEQQDAAWIPQERERFADLYTLALERQLRFFQGRGELNRSIQTGERILRHDPYREDIHAMLIDLYADGGQPKRALRQFRRCSDLIEGDLGLPATAARRSMAALTPRARSEVADATHEDLLAILSELYRDIAALQRKLGRLQEGLRRQGVAEKEDALRR